MKKLIMMLLSLLFWSSTPAQTKGFYTDLSGGIVIPGSGLSADSALTSISPMLSPTFGFMTKHLGLELKGAYFKNTLSDQWKQVTGRNGAPIEIGGDSNKWKSWYGALGPVIRLGSRKVDFRVSPKFGLLNARKRDLEQLTGSVGQDNKWKPYLDLGSRLNFNLTEQLGLHVKMDYLSNSLFDRNQLGSLMNHLPSPKAARGNDQTELVLNPSQLLQIGVGLTYSFSQNNPETREPERNCEPTKLITPMDEAVFVLTDETRPSFSWQNSGEKEVKYYFFRLYQAGELVFEEKTKQNSFKHFDELEEIYVKAGEEGGSFEWTITTVYKKCEEATSASQTFHFINRSGAFHEIFDLECDEPPYTANGDLRIKGKIRFFNNISASAPLIINSINDIVLKDGSGSPLGTTLSNLRTCGYISAIIFFPLSIPPGGSQTYCFDLVVPAGTSVLGSEAKGYIKGLEQISNDQDELPECGCKTCDKWKISSANSSMVKTPYGGQFFNAMIFQEFQIANANPMMNMKAEIVYVKHVANEPECYTCTKHDNDMGLISYGGIKPKEIVGTGNWDNSRDAHKGVDNIGISLDTNNDDYLNQIIWRAADQTQGVDLSGTPHRFRIPINLPKPSSLQCCDHRYQVCVRYTFTDIDCITCDYLVCYEMSTTDDGTGLDPGSGTGNQTGGGLGSN